MADTERARALRCSTGRPLADQLLRTTLDQVLRIGFFHADPHPGNVFVFDDGSLGLIDFGAVGRLDPIQQAAVLDMLVALVRRDVGLLRDGIERVADVAEAASRRAPGAGPRPALADERAARPGRSSPTVFQDLVALLGRVRPPPARRPRAAVAGAGHPRRHAPGPRPRGVAGRGRDRA